MDLYVLTGYNSQIYNESVLGIYSSYEAAREAAIEYNSADININAADPYDTYTAYEATVDDSPMYHDGGWIVEVD